MKRALLGWLDWFAGLNPHSQPSPYARPALAAETGAPVCASASAPYLDRVIHCTYPAGHGLIIDSDGQAWDHGLNKIGGSIWKEGT